MNILSVSFSHTRVKPITPATIQSWKKGRFNRLVTWETIKPFLPVSRKTERCSVERTWPRFLNAMIEDGVLPRKTVVDGLRFKKMKLSERKIEANPSYEKIKETFEAVWKRIKEVWDAFVLVFVSEQVANKQELEEAARRAEHVAHQKELALAANQGFIFFYNVSKGLTGFLSNFEPSPMVLFGMRFECAEGAYWARKFQDYPDMMREFCTLDWVQAHEKANQLERILENGLSGTEFNQWQNGWLRVSYENTLLVVRAKFEQNMQLNDLLQATGNAFLVEHSDDMFWGCGPNGDGYNALGKILMQVRSELRSAISGEKITLPPPPRSYWEWIKRKEKTRRRLALWISVNARKPVVK